MRSKESPPLLRTPQDDKDVEAATTEAATATAPAPAANSTSSGPTGDNNEVEARPYEPTTAPLLVKENAVKVIIT